MKGSLIMKKSILALLLVATMLLSVLPMTVFATGTSYAITNGTPESAKEANHGYIVIDKATAAEGETVTITVKPNEGYQLKSLTVTPAAPAEYTVTFDLNGVTGTAPTSQTIKDGEKVTKPADPTDTVHTFAGWYKTKDATTGALSDPWNFDTDTVTADMTLYAQWERTMESIMDTNENMPLATDSLIAPANAWVRDGTSEVAYRYKTTDGSFMIVNNPYVPKFGVQVLSTEKLVKVGNTYVGDWTTDGFGVLTCIMSNGVFTSALYEEGTKLTVKGFTGTYAAPVKYMAWDETNKQLVEKETTNYIEVTDETKEFEGGKFYVVKDTVTITKGISVSGTVDNPTTLILADGAQLTAGNGQMFNTGITVKSGKALIITCQSGGTGKLVATGSAYGQGPGIGGGGNITIIGGIVTANGGSGAAGIGGGNKGAGGTVTIYGGEITATGHTGIGGGYNGAGGTITINGGTVNATGDVGAGIGGGQGKDGGTITINGGTVTATASGGAGIGGGDNGAGGTITINGGTVTATSEHGAGIGGGQEAAGGNITINGGTVTATSSNAGAGIGGGDSYNMGGYDDNGGGPGSGGNITINNGTVIATGKDGAGIGGGINAAGGTITINGGNVTATGGASKGLVKNGGAGIGGGKYGAGGTIKITGGTVNATGAGAGIGGGDYGAGGTVTIEDGEVTATSNGQGAGIGGGYNGAGGNITIEDGEVTATGERGGAGIGGGSYGAGGTVTINGGTVTATSEDRGAGIGGGMTGAGGTVTINDGTVTATGCDGSAGIGGGYCLVATDGEVVTESISGGNGGEVTINGGTVTATGGIDPFTGEFGGAGIGGGGGFETSDGKGGTLTINGGNGGTVTINGGSVTATGNEAIGMGAYGTESGTLTFKEGVSFTINAGDYVYDTSSKTTTEYAEDHSAAYVSIEEASAPKLLKSSASKQHKSSAPVDPETITPEKQQDGTYQFTMPANGVIVTAEFEPVPPELTTAEAAAIAAGLEHNIPTTTVYSITGYVTQTNGTISKGQQTFWLDDEKGDKKTFEGYWCNLPANEEPLRVGDRVKIVGNILRYNSTYEIKNGNVTILERAHSITNGTPESAKETNHGYIAIDKATAAESETVTITVKPNEGYQFKSLKYNDGEDHTITVDKDGKYTFTMTAEDVTVTAEFEALPHYTEYANWQIKYGNSWEWSDDMTKVEDGLFKIEILWEGTGFNVKSDENTIKKDWFAPEELTIADEVLAPVIVDVYLRIIDDETLIIGIGEDPAPTHTHAGTKQNGQPATETAAGYNDYYKCDCGLYFEDEDCTVEIGDETALESWKTGEGAIAKLVHTITPVSAQAATQTEAGFKAYYECKNCGKYYEDATGLIEITDLSAWKAKGGNGYIPSGDEIDAAKTEAKAALDSENAKDALLDETALTNGKSAIDSAETLSDIENAKTNAITAIQEAQATELANAKTNAKNALDTEEAKDPLTDKTALTNGKISIDEATTKAEVEEAKNNALDAIKNAQKSELDAAKDVAKSALDTEEAKDPLTDKTALTNGKNSIDSAATKAAVEIAKTNAITAIQQAQKAEHEIPEPPQDGDDSNMTLWVILMVLSSMGLCACLARGKKRNIMQ